MRDVVLTSILMLASAALFIFCDALSAHWGKTDSHRSLAALLVLAPFSYFLFALITRQVGLAVAGALVNSVVVAGAIVIGVLVFGEELSRTQFAGVAMAFAAVTLLNLS